MGKWLREGKGDFFPHENSKMKIVKGVRVVRLEKKGGRAWRQVWLTGSL